MQLGNITFDAEDPQRLATFWAEATGRTVERSEPYFAVLAADATGARMLFLKVPEGKTAKNRMHLDFHTENRAAEVARLVGLGATQHESQREYGVIWTVLSDPEGNEFCVGQQDTSGS